MPASTSYIVHRSPDGDRLLAVLSLSILRSLDPSRIHALNGLGIFNISDLLHYAPVHRARLIMAVAQGLVAHDMDLRTLIDDTVALPNDPATLAAASCAVIDGIGPANADVLDHIFHVHSVADFAQFAPFVEAEELLENQEEPFSEPASAPDELIPRPIGSVSSETRLSSFFIDHTLRISGTLEEDRSLRSDPVLGKLFAQISGVVTLPVGYIALNTQRWVKLGTHLGEVVHSLGIAPGTSRNVATIDWRRSQVFQRVEGTTSGEELSNTLVNSRALDEVAQGVAQEHQWGHTIAGAATGTAGFGMVAAGAAVGGLAGGATGTATGAAAGAVVGAVIGAVTGVGVGSVPGWLAGMAVGAVVGGVAGTAAGAALGGAAGGIGFIVSDSKGRREVAAEDRQNIMQLTAQKSSYVRSLRSTIMMDDRQAESAQATTFNITNYNHSHALNLVYYEILNRYSVELRTVRLEPFIILPFNVVNFTKEIIALYWDILRFGISDQNLRAKFDQLVRPAGSLDLPDALIDPTQAVVEYMEFRVLRPVGSDFPGPDGSGRSTCWVEARSGSGPALFYERDGSDLGTGLDQDKIKSADDFRMTVNDVTRLHFQLRAHTTPLYRRSADYQLQLTEVRFRMPGASDVHHLNNLDLGKQSVGAGKGEENLEYNIYLTDALTAQQSGNQGEFDTVDSVVAYIQRRRYLFTRILLAGIETEQVVDLINSLLLTASGDTSLLALIADPVPYAYTARGIMLRVAASRDSSPAALLPLNGWIHELAKDFALRQKAGDDVTGQEIFLPSNGVFCEAVLGRANSSEKLELTRYWNWQDSPIPNAAPDIQPVDTGSRAEPMPSATPTVPGNVLNIMQPAALPNPQGMTDLLAALQNGNMFRDMSKAEVLGGVLNNLAGVAEKVATAAGSLSGQAAADALKGATDIAKSAADTAAKLAAAAPEQPASGSTSGTGSAGSAATAPSAGNQTKDVPNTPQTNISQAGAWANRRDKQVKTPSATDPEEGQFHFIFTLLDQDGVGLAGSFNVKVALGYKQIEVTEADFVVGGNWADLFSLPRIKDIGKVELLGNPSTTQPLDSAMFSGSGIFFLPASGSSLAFQAKLKYTTIKVNAKDTDDVKNKTTKAINGEISLDPSSASDLAPLLGKFASAAALLKLMGLVKFKVGGAVTWEDETTHTQERGYEYEVHIPNGGLEIVMQTAAGG